MRRWGFSVGVIVACGFWAGVAAIRADGQRANGKAPAAPTAAAQIALGRETIIGHACGDCHGGFEDPADPGWLQGVKVPEQQEFKVGPFTQRPSNLTPDDETGTGKYTERQIFNAMRYGLRPSATPDVEITSTTPGQGNFPAAPHYLSPGMPWAAFKYLTDAELRAIAAYLKRALKPATNKVQDSEGPPDFWAGEFQKPTYGTRPAVNLPTANETAVSNPQIVHGRDLVIKYGCGDCHGGFQNPADPGWLQGVKAAEQEFKIGPFTTRPRNLTPDNTTGLGRFTERQIFNALRYGLRPGETPDVEISSTAPGHGNFPASPHFLAPPMPWNSWKYMSDADLKAIAAYLKRGVKPVANKVADSEGPPDFWVSEYKKAQYGSRPPIKYPTVNEK